MVVINRPTIFESQPPIEPGIARESLGSVDQPKMPRSLIFSLATSMAAGKSSAPFWATAVVMRETLSRRAALDHRLLNHRKVSPFEATVAKSAKTAISHVIFAR